MGRNSEVDGEKGSARWFGRDAQSAAQRPFCAGPVRGSRFSRPWDACACAERFRNCMFPPRIRFALCTRWSQTNKIRNWSFLLSWHSRPFWLLSKKFTQLYEFFFLVIKSTEFISDNCLCPSGRKFDYLSLKIRGVMILPIFIFFVISPKSFW